jgi:hypothetical protein
MSGRHSIIVLTLAAATTGSASWAEHDAPAREQATDQTPTIGRIVGSITPHLPSGFHIRLFIPATITEIAEKNSDQDGHFTLEGIQPGTYQLEIRVLNVYGGCRYLPWSKQITIQAGKTTSLKATV